MSTKQNNSLFDVKPEAKTRLIVIWLHGLGANAHDFEPVLPLLNQFAPGVRYIFPNAPLKRVSVNGGMMMPAWYDIIHPDLSMQPDIAGIKKSSDYLADLVNQTKMETGLPVVIAGFSQGGVIALYTGLSGLVKVDGILALSAYLPADANFTAKNEDDLEVFMAHGTDDPIVPIKHAKLSFSKIQQMTKNAIWHEYQMDHSLTQDEVIEIGKWLNAITDK